MKNLRYLGILILPLVLMVGCSSDSDDPPPPPPEPPSDAEVLAEGWSAYTTADYAEAETQFRELLGRNALVAEAHDGLGWTFARQSAADSALTHHEASLVARGDTLAIADQMYAGLAFARSAAGDNAGCVTAAGEVATGWVFDHDSDLDYDDVVLVTAMAHYALGDFADALVAVQVLDPDFTADVDTVEGRAALAARIEELQG